MGDKNVPRGTFCKMRETFGDYNKFMMGNLFWYRFLIIHKMIDRDKYDCKIATESCLLVR